MFVENLEEVPESWREQFVEVEVDGKKGYQDKESNKAFNFGMSVKAEKAAIQAKLEEMSAKLDGFEQAKIAEIEKAKADALEQAKSAGDIEAIEARYKEQMTDVEARAEARGRELASKEFSVKEAKMLASNEFDKIVNELKPLSKDHEILLRDHLKSRQTVTDDGKIVYLNADGSASSLDSNGFLAEVKEAPTVKALVKAESATFGGGNVNGSSSGSAQTSHNQAAENAKKTGDVTSFLSASLKNINLQG